MKEVESDLKKRILKEYEGQMHKHGERWIKVLAIAGAVVGALYISSYFINAMTRTVRACKDLKRAVKE